MTRKKATILAARFYLCAELPTNYDKLPSKKLDDFIEANAWQPFEYHEASTLWKYIDDLANEFIRISNS